MTRGPAFSKILLRWRQVAAVAGIGLLGAGDPLGGRVCRLTEGKRWTSTQ